MKCFYTAIKLTIFLLEDTLKYHNSFIYLKTNEGTMMFIKEEQYLTFQFKSFSRGKSGMQN